MNYNIEAERASLGILLVDGTQIDDVQLQPKDYYEKAHQLIFRAMQCLHEKSENIDLVSVTTFLADKGELGNVGGVDYLSQLAGSVASTHTLSFHVSIVTKNSQLRKATDLVASMQQALIQDQNIEQVQKIAEQIRDLGNQAGSAGQHIKDVVVKSYENIEERAANKGQIKGIATGYSELDRMLAGLDGGQYFVIGARPSVGKTAFALNVASNASKDVETMVDIYSLEMSAEDLVERQLSSEGHINSQNIRTGLINDDDWTKLSMSMGTLAYRDIVIYDEPRCFVETIRQNAKKRRRENPDKRYMILVDYLQLMQHINPNKTKNDMVSDISREFKLIAREFNAVMVVLSQLSRGVEQRQDKRPMLSDLRDSGSIEQDADIIGFLYRDDYYDKETENKNIIELIVAKQRKGPVGTVQLAFVKEYQKMVNLERRFSEQ